jgi:hypothetical protein
MIALNDDELQIVMSAAAPLQPHARDQFLRDCAAELSRYLEIGPGIIARVTGRLQREHMNPQQRGRPHEGKWR